MNWDYREITQVFSSDGRERFLSDGKWGLEKESQRITAEGDLALTSHPAAFGNKLNNPFITTDFAESQLELITPPFTAIEAAHAALIGLQVQAEAGIGGELLWPLSMPPRLPEESEIPIARFGNSEAGREWEIYRQGLALRYGKKMQMISGIHYNFSFGARFFEQLYRKFGGGRSKQDFINQCYFALARNFLRYRWLLIYLLGASPSVDPTYDSVICRELELVGKCCPEYVNIISEYKQYATSLRVSRFGYVRPEQGKEHRFFDDLNSYLGNIRHLMTAQSLKYAEMGICRDGSRQQLNDRVLQKDSEFYAPIRLKQTLRAGESQLEALSKRGVQYVEIRILDLNPFERVGISLQQLYLLHVFMLFCLFEDSPPIDEAELERINKNHHTVALFGRKPQLQLEHYQDGSVSLNAWGKQLFAKLWPIAGMLDLGRNDSIYLGSLGKEQPKLDDPMLLPSTQMERERQQHQEQFLDFGVRYAKQHKQINLKEGINYANASGISEAGVINAAGDR